MSEISTLIDIDLLKNCIKGNRKSQKRLYEVFAPKMFALCLKFFKKRSDAEDVLQEGFIKLFNNLHTFRHEGSFDGWVRRIFVNAAIEYNKKQKIQTVCASEFEENIACTRISPLDNLYRKDVVELTTKISNGYRTVFTMYAIEGYSHKEISEILGISESTSKSQYLRAKASIRQLMGARERA